MEEKGFKGGKGGLKKDGLVDRCKKLSTKLINELEKIALSPSWKDTRAKISAIDMLLDRAYGKPKETVENKGVPRIIEIIHAPQVAQDIAIDAGKGIIDTSLGVGVGKDIGQAIKQAEN